MTSLGVFHAQNARDDAVATAMGGASANPASKVFRQSLTAWAAERFSSLIDLEMAGTETREIDAMVPGGWLGGGETLGLFGVSGVRG